MNEKYKKLPLRSGVGIILLNKENKDISDQAKYLLDQKIDVLKSLNLN